MSTAPATPNVLGPSARSTPRSPIGLTGRLRSADDLPVIEATPWREQLPVAHTYGLLRTACERHGDRIALRLLTAGHPDAPVRSITYADLLAGVHRSANALHALGVGARTPVALLLPNLIENHLALWGAQATGIASPINPLLDEAYITQICRETGAEVIVAPGPVAGADRGADLWAKAVRVAERLPAVRALVQVDLPTALNGPAPGHCRAPVGERPAGRDVQVLDFHTLLDQAAPTHLVSARVFGEDEPCAYFHTGGTTGWPKIAVHSHRNEAFLAWVLASGFGADNVLLSGLPLFHVNGALVTGLAAFHAGFEVVLLTPGGYRTPGVIDRFWDIANHFGATGFSAVPTLFAALAARPLPPEGIATLRHAICGAAPLPPQVAADFERATGLRLHEGYGLTEGTCVSALNPPLGERCLGTVGVRLPYQDLRLFRIDAQGQAIGEAAPGEVGVIGIRGPNVFPGYLREADNARLWLAEGWLNTGDLGRFDAQGRLVLAGRAKELIIRGGHNIDPALIEDALGSHPAVAMAAAVGQPDRHAGELPVAYVALRRDAQATQADLLAHARRSIPERAAVPVRIEVLPALPLTAIGKVAKPQLRLAATDHVLNEALDLEGLRGVRAQTRLSPEAGTVVDLRGPAGQRDAAMALAGQYPVTPEWQGDIA
jgi:fatty-acyl-CoA synthase